MTSYFLNHWYGKHPLWQAFWINLVAFRCALFLLQDSLISPDHLQEPLSVWSAIGVLLLLHGVLFVWQIVGVIRSAENDYAERGTLALVWGTQLMCVVFFFLSASYGLQVYQSTLAQPEDENILETLARERAKRYQLELLDHDKVLQITGQIEPGITKLVEKMLKQEEAINLIRLNSPGGNIFEGRGLSNLFRDQYLNTEVLSECASACTIAFIGGIQRRASRHARIGFHQYRIDADYNVIVTNVEAELEKDRDRYLEAGVNEKFVIKMFNSVADDMWWPDIELLIEAGVVHHVIEQ